MFRSFLTKLLLITLMLLFLHVQASPVQAFIGGTFTASCTSSNTITYSVTAPGVPSGHSVIVAVTTSDGSNPLNIEPAGGRGVSVSGHTITFTSKALSIFAFESGSGQGIGTDVSIAPIPGCGSGSSTAGNSITTFFPECANPPVKLSAVAITTRQPAYASPGGAQAQSMGLPIFLPDGPTPGREFTVISTASYKDQLWFGVWLAGCTPIWVPASGVTLLAPLSTPH